MTVATPVPILGAFTMPPLVGKLDGLWDVILDLTQQIPAGSWALVGGQMVLAHGLLVGRTPTRVSGDIDVLGNMLSSSGAVRRAVTAVRQLGFEPEPTLEGSLLYRFRRQSDGHVVDVLAPDHTPPSWKLTSVPPHQTLNIDGGNQALKRLVTIEVTKDGRTESVPVPNLLGALMLKAAAHQVDSRDRARHATDAGFLTSLIVDPLQVRQQFKGSDGKRLHRLNEEIGTRDHMAWNLLGDAANDAYATWQILTR